MFSTTLMATQSEVKSLGMTGHGRQVRAVIATTSKTRAAKAFRMSLYEFNNYGSEAGPKDGAARALGDPEVVFITGVDQRFGNRTWMRRER